MPESMSDYDGSPSAFVLTDVEPTHLEIMEYFSALTLPANIHTNFKVSPLTILSVSLGNLSLRYALFQTRAPSYRQLSSAR